MKCKRHPSEQGAGVCAPCLRDRLLILLADQHNHPSSRSKKRDNSSPPSLFLAPLESTTATHRRFSLFPSVFASNDSETSSSSSSSWWISSLIPRRRAKEKRVRSYGPSVRGMSPAADDDASGSGYSTESPAGVRRKTTPDRPTDECRRRHRRRRRGGGGLADFVVCLSPLVRPGPTGRRRRHQETESGFSSELGRNGKPVHFGPNRSWKLADRTRFR